MPSFMIREVAKPRRSLVSNFIPFRLWQKKKKDAAFSWLFEIQQVLIFTKFLMLESTVFHSITD